MPCFIIINLQRYLPTYNTGSRMHEASLTLRRKAPPPLPLNGWVTKVSLTIPYLHAMRRVGACTVHTTVLPACLPSVNGQTRTSAHGWLGWGWAFVEMPCLVAYAKTCYALRVPCFCLADEDERRRRRGIEQEPSFCRHLDSRYLGRYPHVSKSESALARYYALLM